MTAQHNNEQAAPRPLQMGAKGAYIVRLLMVGDSSCGKTSLVLRFDQNVFSTKFVTTIGVDYRDKMVKVCFCYAKNVYQIMLFSLLILHLDLMTLCHTQLFFLTPLSDRRGANEASTLGHCRAGTVP